MKPENFSVGYYIIIGIPDNRSENWFESEDTVNNDKFLWIPSLYETPLHQAQRRSLMATRRETRRDTVSTLSIAPECGPISTDWKVEIDNEKCGITVSGNCEFTGFHAIEYVGPPEMHTYEYRRENEMTNLYRILYGKAETLCEKGDHRFRRSRKSGLVMYNGYWPRWHSDGSWWEGARENSYLCFDDDKILNEQWEWIFNRDKWEEKYNKSNPK